MFNGIPYLGWVIVLFSFGAFCGICWVHRTRRTATNSLEPGTRISPPELRNDAEELWQDEDDFEEVVDVFMVQDDYDESEQELKPPACHPIALAMSQAKPLVAARTLRLYRET